MRKFLIFCALFKCSISFEQIRQSVTIGPDLGLPYKYFGRNSKVGFGASWDYQVKISAHIGAQFHLGYIKFGDKEFTNSWVTFLPIRAGIVGYVYEDVIFVFADAGISHFHDANDDSQTGFSFGAGGGYKLYFNPDKKQMVQFSAYFNLHNFTRPMVQSINYTWFNIRVAYGASFGKKSTIEK